MDPEQAWRDLADAINADDQESAVQLAYDLRQWLALDGFPPKLSPHPAFNRMVVHHVCLSIVTGSFR